MNNRENQPYDEEINLYEYWLVIRKHWLLMAFLIMVAIGGTFFWTRNSKQSFAVTTAISLGRIEVDGKTVPITNLANIQQFLNSGSFVNQIVRSLKLDEKRYLPSLRGGLEAQAKDNTENVLFIYNTTEPEVGIKILEKLTEQFKETYAHRTTSGQKTKDAEIKKLKEKITGIEAKRDQIKLDIKQLQEDIAQNNESLKIKTNIKNNDIQGTTSQATYLKDRLVNLEADKKKLLNRCEDLEKKLNSNVNAATSAPSFKFEQNIAMSGILQDNHLQQLLGLLTSNYDRIQSLDKEIDTIQNRILNLNIQAGNLKETAKQQAVDTTRKNNQTNLKIQILQSKQEKEIDTQIEGVKDEIAVLEIQRGLIEGIITVAPPGYLNIPLKSKQPTFMIVAILGSLTIGILLAFFLEWINKNQKHMERMHSTQNSSSKVS